ncbi:MAG TPA: outer membrane lipoprotein carrier protein LolA [Terriglobales bacterium]|nr:outer membrane lipoprotein carrier protein LolA [Terriglobales bacterium]
MAGFVLAILTVFLNVGSVDDAKAAVRALESRYARAHTLKAAFFERFSDGNGSAQSESGVVYFSRPGRMRWDYESPEQKLFLVDGTNVWFMSPPIAPQAAPK